MFIELTCSNSKERIAVNINQVEFLTVGKNARTEIKFQSGSFLLVEESFDEVYGDFCKFF